MSLVRLDDSSGISAGPELARATEESREGTRSSLLFLTPRFPFPPDRGDRLHAYHLLRVLGRRFRVTLVTTAPAAMAREEALDAIRRLNVEIHCHELSLAGRVHRLGIALIRGLPLQVAYYDSPRLRRQVESFPETFDAVVCHLIRMVPLARRARARIRVLDAADSIALGLQRRLEHAPLLERPSIWLEAARVRGFEAGVLGEFDEAWLVSGADRESFPGDRSKLVVLRPGVEGALLAHPVARQTEPVIGFLGHLRVPHNVDAALRLAREILPAVRASGIAARVRLMGADPRREIRELARVPNVEVCGFQPDLGRALRELRVLCAPLRFSSGVQSKLVDALAAGTPVVTSPEAIAGLGSEASRWVWPASTTDEYVRSIAGLWERTPAILSRLEQARVWVGEAFRWESYADRLEFLLRSRFRADWARS